MSLKCEVIAFNGSGSTPQTVNLVDTALVPKAIILMGHGRADDGAFAAGGKFSMGFGTRRGGSTQSGCWGYYSVDNVATGDCAYVRNTTLLHILSSTAATDYTVSLDSFGTGQFTVSYSSAANASGDTFVAIVLGGDDITDANVLNWTMDSTGATEVVTGVGFLPTAVFGLDTGLASANSITAGIVASFGFASSATQFVSMALTQTDGDTMTSAMNWNKSYHTDSFLERLTLNADTQDAQWDVDSFDSDGATLGVVNAPTGTTGVATLLFLKGGQWEAGSDAKIGTTGNETVTLANSGLTPRGVIQFTTRQTATGITAGNTDLCVGMSDGTFTNGHRYIVGTTGPEAINTQCDNIYVGSLAMAELTGGATPAGTSSGTVTQFNAGNFVRNWGVNGGSLALFGHMAFGDNAAATPTRGRISFAEFEAPFLATRGRISFAELETPFVPTRGRISFTEFEVPTTLTRGRISFTELEVPNPPGNPTRGLVSWAEFEIPDLTPTRGRISWVEFETPFAPTRGRLSFTEFEVPGAPTRGRVSWAEFQVPDVGSGFSFGQVYPTIMRRRRRQ